MESWDGEGQRCEEKSRELIDPGVTRYALMLHYHKPNICNDIIGYANAYYR